MTWGIKGAGTRGLELPGGTRVAVSPVGRARIRYNETSMILEQSLNGGAWVALSGSGSPGGADHDVQFNNAGAFGGNSDFTWDAIDLAFTGRNIDLDPTGNFSLDMDAAQRAIITAADNLADAFLVQVGVDPYIDLRSVNASESLRFGNATTNPDYAFLGTGTMTIDGALDFDGSTIDLDPTGDFTLDMDAAQTVAITVSDNLADALLIQEGANDYLALTTVNASEAFDFGNVTTNPEYHFLGTGLFTMGGQLDINGSIEAPSAQRVEIGTLAPTTGVLIARSGATVGFYGNTGATQATVTGSRAGNAAVASLLTGLAATGLIIDSTSA